MLAQKVPFLEKENTNIPNDWDRAGLPAWSFFNNEMFEAEKDLLFRRHWQLVCHSSDIPNNGDFVTCLLYTSPSPRDATLSRMPSSA